MREKSDLWLWAGWNVISACAVVMFVKALFAPGYVAAYDYIEIFTDHGIKRSPEIKVNPPMLGYQAMLYPPKEFFSNPTSPTVANLSALVVLLLLLRRTRPNLVLRFVIVLLHPVIWQGLLAPIAASIGPIFGDPGGGSVHVSATGGRAGELWVCSLLTVIIASTIALFSPLPRRDAGV